MKPQEFVVAVRPREMREEVLCDTEGCMNKATWSVLTSRLKFFGFKPIQTIKRLCDSHAPQKERVSA